MNLNSGNVAWSVRGFLIYALALPLLPAVLAQLDGGSVRQTAALSSALALFVLGALGVRYGIRAQRRHASSRYTGAGTHLLTWLGCACVAAGCFVSQYLIAGAALAYALVIAGIGLVGAYLSYGSMWWRPKPVSADGYTSDEVIDALREAETKVSDIQAVYVRLPHGEIRRKLKRLTKKTYRLMQTIEQRPAQLRKARKFLNVFLPGVQNVAQTYKTSLDGARDPEFDRRFNELLDKTDAALDRHAAQRADEVAFDLDVQMEVLRTQLDHEIRS